MLDKVSKPLTDSCKPYQYARDFNCLTNFLDHVCFATQNLVGHKKQFLAKITKPPPAGKHQTSTMCWLQLVRAFMSLLNSVKALVVGR